MSNLGLFGAVEGYRSFIILTYLKIYFKLKALNFAKRKKKEKYYLNNFWEKDK